MTDISKITLLDGIQFNLKDFRARKIIEDISNQLDIIFDINSSEELIMTWVKEES